nr:MAG TPA: hypothetical protein [Caudoviricetes sp.]
MGYLFFWRSIVCCQTSLPFSFEFILDNVTSVLTISFGF